MVTADPVFVHSPLGRASVHRQGNGPPGPRVVGAKVDSPATNAWPRSEGEGMTGTHEETSRSEQGITTAEYAVGTAAGAGLAGVLYQLVTGGYGDQMLRRMFDHVMGMLGIG